MIRMDMNGLHCQAWRTVLARCQNRSAAPSLAKSTFLLDVCDDYAISVIADYGDDDTKWVIWIAIRECIVYWLEPNVEYDKNIVMILILPGKVKIIRSDPFGGSSPVKCAHLNESNKKKWKWWLQIWR